MRVGTDSVMLGAWVRLPGSPRILDVGTGTGILALFCASRNADARVTAIDIHGDSVRLSEINFRDAAFGDRLNVMLADFKALSEDETYFNSFDILVSNPPFFNDSRLPENKDRLRIRHTSELSHAALVSGAAKLLRSAGKLNLILPITAWTAFCDTAVESGFHLRRMTMVRPKPGAAPNRVLSEWELMGTDTPGSDAMINEEMAVRNNDGSYHDDYRTLAGRYHDRPI